MGRTGTYNYQVQVKKPGTEGDMLILGAMKFKEAMDILLEEARRIGSSLGYIWPQTVRAKKKIKNDYLKIRIEPNTYTVLQGSISPELMP